METTRQQCDELHPETKLPEGYVWMIPCEKITIGCKFARPWDPKWHDVTCKENGAGEMYKPGRDHQMIRPAPTTENEIAETYQKFDVGYEDELIGAYHGFTPEEAIEACKSDMRTSGFRPSTPVKERAKGMIAIPQK